MREYMNVGVENVILSGHLHLEEAYRVAELVFSRLNLAHQVVSFDRARNSAPVRRDGGKRLQPSLLISAEI